MTRRLCCCVPFCRRTRGDRKGDPLPTDLANTEWICGPHWRAVSRKTKARRRQLDRRRDRIEAAWQRRGYADRICASGRYIKYAATLTRAYRDAYDAWGRCKAEAIERAMGITA